MDSLAVVSSRLYLSSQLLYLQILCPGYFVQDSCYMSSHTPSIIQLQESQTELLRQKSPGRSQYHLREPYVNDLLSELN